MSNANVTQSAIEFITLQSPEAVITQSAIELIISPPIPPSPPPIVPGQPATIVGGTPYGIPPPAPACGRPNVYDDCLRAIEERWRKIQLKPSINLPCEYTELPWEELPGILPEGAKPFHQVGTVTLPAVPGDTLVTSLRVPYGYDGILVSVFQQYTGQFDAGDIVWRIRIDQRYLQNFGASPFQLGNTRFPFPLSEGEILFSGQTVRYFVDAVNSSGTLPAGGNIVCGLVGFWWPR